MVFLLLVYSIGGRQGGCKGGVRGLLRRRRAYLIAFMAASKASDCRGGRLLSCARPRDCSIHLQARQTANGSSFRPMAIDQATHVDQCRPTRS